MRSHTVIQINKIITTCFFIYFSEIRVKKNIYFTIAISVFFMASEKALADEYDSSNLQPYKLELADSYGGYNNVDQIDPRSGNLIIRNRDLILPGNGGLNIEIWRTYDMQSQSVGYGETGHIFATHNQSYSWTALGPGWTLSGAPRIYYNFNYRRISSATGETEYRVSELDAMCKSFSHSDYLDTNGVGRAKILLPDGSEQEIFISGQEGRTRGNWKVVCPSGNLIAYSPLGVKYDFGNYSAKKRLGKVINSGADVSDEVAEGAYPTPLQNYFLALSATDPNGNRLDFEYKNFGSLIVPWVINSITPYRIKVKPYNTTLNLMLDSTSEAYGTPGSYTVDWLEPDFEPNYISSITENSSALLSAIVANDGRRVNFNYDTNTGRLLSMTDNTGRTWSYEYLTPDQNNSRSLSKVILPTGLTWQYEYKPGEFYDYYWNFCSCDVTARNLNKIITPTGGSISYNYGLYTYNRKGNFGGYATAEVVTQRAVSTGESWNYSYVRRFSDGGNSWQYDTTTVTGPEGTTTYQFMGTGYKSRTSINAPSSASDYQNNAWQVGQLMSKTDPLGNTETYTWQPRLINTNSWYIGDLGRVWDQNTWFPDLQQRTVTRNGATYTTTYANYDAYGNPGTKTETGPNGESRTTNYSHFNDPNKWIIGLVKDETSPGLNIYRNYDANGNLLAYNRNEAATYFTYDSQGNLATKYTPRGYTYSYTNYKRGIPQNESQPEGIIINRVVDDAGNITAETNGDGHTTAYTYDGLNRMTSEDKPRGNTVAIAYTANSRTVTRGDLIEQTQYDPFGKISSVTLGGIITHFNYDVFGRKTFESYPGESIGTAYQYDALGRLVRAINGDGTYQTHYYGPGTQAITDERGHTTTYTYKAYGDPDEQVLMGISAPVPSASIALTRNARDLVTSVTQGGLTRTYGYNAHYYLTSITNPETGVTEYGRDAEGNMTTRQVGASGVTTYAYDGQNRLSSVVYPGTTNGITYTYNKTGKLVSAKRYGGSRGFSYDANNNITSETISGRNQQFKVVYAYDGNDKLASITYPYSGRLVSYTNDALGRPIQIPGYINGVTYWPSGLIKQINYANGTISNYSKNTRLWPSEFKTRKTGLSNYYLNTAYSYDGIGNLTSIQDSVDSTLSRTLGYDPVNRLVTANGFWGNGAITYDGVGNLTGQVLGNTSLNYRYDSLNRLESVSGLRAATYAYDAYGNVSASANSTYGYDGVPNLRCIDCGNPLAKTEYDYDGLNHRFFVSQKGVPSYEIYDSSGKLLSELTIGQPNKLTEYIYLGGKRIAQHVSP